MPLIVTDGDVLAQIAETDGDASAIDSAVSSLTTLSAATSSAWKSFYAGYQAWATQAKAALGGGFIAGAWFGVPTYGNQAVAFNEQLAAWATTINAEAGTTVLPAAVSPIAVANQNASFPGLGSVISTGAVSLAVVASAGLLLYGLFLAKDYFPKPRARART